MIHSKIAPSRSMAAARQLGRQLGRQLFGAGIVACVLALAACGGGDGSSAGSGGNPAGGGNGSNGGNGPSTNQPLPVGAFVPLSWSSVDPATQYTLTDGTLVTRVGGRVRDRHAREQSETGTNAGGDLYGIFAPHYFERRTHAITIYDNVSPTNPAERILTLVIKPQWWMYGTNFRFGFIGRRDGDDPGPTAVALYGDNGGVKRLPVGMLKDGQELRTPIANYDALDEDPNSNYNTDLNVPPQDGEFVLVKQIKTLPRLNRGLRNGDLVEFELGIFLAGTQGDALGRFNYYADVITYKVGAPGVVPWFRGPCCDAAPIPWDTKLIPPEAFAGGPLMTLHEDASNEPEMQLLQPSLNVAGRNIQPFVEGRRLFHSSFLTGAHVEAGNPTLFDKLANRAGPKFQEAACVQCHTNNGKSSPGFNLPLNNMVVLTGSADANGNVVPDTRFGGRIWQGLVTDGGRTWDGRNALLRISSYRNTAGKYPDGSAYTLQTPVYTLTDVNGNTLPMPDRMSVRASPHLVGMGLLEAVPEATLVALAQASATDPDGTLGRVQIVPDAVDARIPRVGRFGWKASSSTVLQQTADALNGDMGVTTSLLPKHFCGRATTGSDCRAADANGPELGDADVDLISRYLSLLGVPAQRHFKGQQFNGIPAPTIVDQLKQGGATITAAQQAESRMQDRVARGGQLFTQARCTSCHAASLTTGGSHKFAELRNQLIHPYTDLLLHDMGQDLADNYPQGSASGSEWRTAPLWGLGLLSSIDPNTRYLHDGRARTIEEAILWHGGQGAPARDRFKALSADDRQQLIDFVKSL
ncbi:hypothetical protein LMG32289_05094 [Cupriavidus pampae]|uniref:Cytochrome c domain-containing protein n=2 Tax=Cupriavidus pampae TaxID=659251 RepID=A0ABM8XQA3_9BURK|nr:hypothetical protein LMG32289_05094 [Cupriavidus pampae]